MSKEKMIREVVRKMIREEIMKEALSPKQLKIKALFDKKGGSVPDREIKSFLSSIGSKNEWDELVYKSFVGKKPGDNVWHWV